MKQASILVVDDEPAILDMIRTIFAQAGYRNVSTAADAAGALGILRRKMPDLLILDVMLPGEMDGFGLLRAVRAVSRVPVLMLTARGEAADRVAGFEQGADDYLVKPFLPQELLLRVQAILRRAYPEQNRCVRLADAVVDLDRAEVRRPGRAEPIQLTAKEYALFCKLAENAGRIVTIGALCQTVCGEIWQGYENTLMTHIRHLREKLEADPSAPRSLLTVRGLGYRLIVEREEDAP